MLKLLKNSFKYTIIIVVLLAGLITVTSCGNLFLDNIYNYRTEERTGESVIFTGTVRSCLAEDGALPQEYAGLAFGSGNGAYESRSAVPALPASETLSYVVKAETIGSTPKITNNDGSVENGVLSVPLVTGHRWKVTVTIKHTSTSGVETDLLEDFYTMPEGTILTAESPLLEHNFYLKPLEGTGGGYIDLSMSGGTGSSAVFDKVTIASVKQNGEDVTDAWSGGNWNGSSSKLTIAIDNTSESWRIATKTGETIPPGVYDIILHFTRNNQLVYYTTQAVTVFKNMTTSSWVSNGGSNSPISSNGTFEVTPTLVNACMRNVFYVGDTASGITANDNTGTGNPYKPFKTVKKAVDTINHLPERTAQDPYVIRVKDGTTETVEESISVQNNISIECYDSSFDDKAGTATLTRSANVSFFSIENSYALTIDGKSLSPEGTPLSDTEWSGLVLDGKKDAEKTGSGISVNNGGKLTLNGGTISNCSSSSGAGVNNNGQFIMNGGIISDNIASSYGGGVYDEHYSETNVDETFVMNGGIIIRNSAKLGGGVFTEGSKARFFMNDGSITNNAANGTSYYQGGGGVYINSGGRFTMAGGSISGNTGTDGGGVFIYGGESTPSENTIGFTMSGGTIAGNEASKGGGGVYLKAARMCMYGTAVIGDDSLEINTAATSDLHSNIAKVGGGIDVEYNSVAYVGYSDANTPASSTGGIYYNYATGTGASEGGGGIYKATKIANSNIKYNGTAGKGGGIYADSDVMFSDGVVVSGNAATGNGSGVYARGVKLGLQGTAYVQASGTGENDVYLDVYSNGPYTGYGSIIINGLLTLPSAAGGKVAKLTPNSYTRTDVIVNVADSPDPTTTLPAEVGKFAVTPDNGTNYFVNSTGMIEEKQTVAVGNDSGLQSAINEGNSSISVTSNLTLSEGLSLTPSQSVVIDGGNDKATINGGGEHRISAEPTGDITFANIDFTDGKITEDGEGGGMLRLVGNGTNSLTILDCSFKNCSTPDRDTDGNNGGSIYISNFKTVTIENTTFYANDGEGQNEQHQHPATSGGFIFIDVESVSESTINITGCTFTGGYSSHGGAIALHLHNLTEITIDRCAFSNNYANWNGGAIDFSSGSTITIKDSTLTGNTADGVYESGNVFLEGSKTVVLINTTIDGETYNDTMEDSF